MTEPFELGDQMVDQLVAAKPSLATLLGVSGHDHLWDDLSPDGMGSLVDLLIGQRRELSVHLDHPDLWQRHAARVGVDFLGEFIAAFDRKEHLRQLRHTGGDFQDLRDMFDQMDTKSISGWENIVARMETISAPLEGHRASLELGREQGLAVARRQVLSVIEQARHVAGPDSSWLRLLAKARVSGVEKIESSLGAAIDQAQSSVLGFVDYLEGTYLASAPEADGVGIERYVAEADRFLGLEIDPAETYQWGWEEVRRLQAAMTAVAARIDPSATLEGVISQLESDPEYAAPSQQAFVEFIQQLQDQALAQLDGSHFDVPPEIRMVTVNLVPPGAALGAHYLSPTEDFARPGGIWYSLGDRQQIPLWQEVSTGYHEGFPGHHLQVGTSMTAADNLSRLHRLLIWYSGYGEGWALYTERLMDELGYFERPHYLLGMLASQQLRACRVVIDIGCHLGYRIPDQSPVGPGEPWSFERGVELLHQVAGQPLDVAASEVNRYLGWPGQAISYKVGERVILDLREESRRRQGSAFDLKAFHRQLLRFGEVRLDYLGELTDPPRKVNP